MEVVTYKWLLDNFGPLGLVVGGLISMAIWMWRNRADHQKKLDQLDHVKSSLIDSYKEIIADNTRALDQSREQDHADKLAVATLLQEVRTLIQERLPRNRGRD